MLKQTKDTPTTLPTAQASDTSNKDNDQDLVPVDLSDPAKAVLGNSPGVLSPLSQSPAQSPASPGTVLVGSQVQPGSSLPQASSSGVSQAIPPAGSAAVSQASSQAVPQAGSAAIPPAVSPSVPPTGSPSCSSSQFSSCPSS